MLSDALPFARNTVRSNRASLSRFTGLMSVLLCFTVLNACSVGNSTPMPASPTTANPQPGPESSSKNLTVSGKLSDAVEKVSYNATLSVSGGKAPYTFSVSWGKLPAGMTLSKSGTISGKPTQTGTYNFGVHVTDSSDLGGANAFAITVASSSSVTVTVTPPTVSVAASGTEQFTALVTNASNSAVTWSASRGTISSKGLYTAPSVTATTTTTVTATSVADTSKSASAAVTVTTGNGSGLSVTTSSLSSATSGTSYSSTLAASGGKSPYTWSVSSGALPSGITLHSGGTLSGTTTQTGQFSFAAEVTDSSSPKQTASNSLTLTVNSSTGGGNGIKLTFFGADYNGKSHFPGTDSQNQAATLGSVRLWDDGLKWGQINTSSGKYDWSQLDIWLDDAAANGMDVLYTFGDTPQFAAASKAPKSCNVPGAYSCAAPTDVNSDGTGSDAHFQDFVTALVTHAAGRIAFYELWNEPDCTCFWAGTQAQLVRMGKDAAAIIRSLDPAAKILSPSAHGPTMKTWFDGYIAAGGAPNFDIVNVHMRGQHGTNSSPEAFLDIWSDVETELQKVNLTSLPVWDDEHGILEGQGLTDPDMLAGYTARSNILRAGVGLQRQYIYTWDSHSPYGLQNSLSGTAWNVVAGWLIGHTVSACTAAGTVYTCGMDNGQIVWDTAQSCSNGSCTTSNYTYPSNYVWFHDISGNKWALSGKTVQIGYKPIMIAND